MTKTLYAQTKKNLSNSFHQFICPSISSHKLINAYLKVEIIINLKNNPTIVVLWQIQHMNAE
jgi:hypothetical protein